MSEKNVTGLSEQEQNRRIWRGFGNFIDRITPSLFELGIWLFGGLIAFNLLVLASLFTIGPVDPAIKIATAAFAFALPLNLTGLFLLRMIQELKGAALEDELVQSFKEEGFVSDQIPAPAELDAALASMRTRRLAIVLRSSSGILVVSILLTLTGLTSTLWHMAWWIAIGFLIMLGISILLVILVMARSQPPDPPKRE